MLQLNMYLQSKNNLENYILIPGGNKSLYFWKNRNDFQFAFVGNFHDVFQ